MRGLTFVQAVFFTLACGHIFIIDNIFLCRANAKLTSNWKETKSAKAFANDELRTEVTSERSTRESVLEESQSNNSTAGVTEDPSASNFLRNNSETTTSGNQTTDSESGSAGTQPTVTSYLRVPDTNISCNISGKNEALYVRYKNRVILSIHWYKKEEYFKVHSQSLKHVDSLTFRVLRPEKVLLVSFKTVNTTKELIHCYTFSRARRGRIGYIRLFKNEVQKDHSFIVLCRSHRENRFFSYIKLCTSTPSLKNSCSSTTYKPFRTKAEGSWFRITAKEEMNGLKLGCCMNMNHTRLNDQCVYSRRTLQIGVKVHNLAVFPAKETYKIGDTVLCTAEGLPVPETSWDVERKDTPGVKVLSDTLRLTRSGHHNHTCYAKNAFIRRIYRAEKSFRFFVVKSTTNKTADTRQTIAFALCGLLLTAFCVSFLIIFIRKSFSNTNKIADVSQSDR